MLAYSKSISPIGLPNQLFLVSYMYMYMYMYNYVAIQGWGGVGGCYDHKHNCHALTRQGTHTSNKAINSQKFNLNLT